MQKFTKEQWPDLKRLLVEGGCPVLQEEIHAVSPVGLKIEQELSLGVNMVLDLENGQAGYVMDLVITNESDRPIGIQRFELKTPWGGAGISLLPGPVKSGPRKGHYCFPGSGSLAFESEVVLNRFMSSRERLNPGQHPGLFLGIEESPIPCHYPEYSRTAVELAVFDTKGNRYSSEFRLCVDRSVSCALERREKTKDGGSGRGKSQKGVLTNGTKSTEHK
jgi:hypothetical protein